MKIWVDDVREPPEGYVWVRSTNEAIRFLAGRAVVGWLTDGRCEPVEVIDLDHDSGEFAKEGGDYIEVLKWVERYNNTCLSHNSPEELFLTSYHIHSMNPVGVQNMRAIIQRNGWKEV